MYSFWTYRFCWHHNGNGSLHENNSSSYHCSFPSSSSFILYIVRTLRCRVSCRVSSFSAFFQNVMLIIFSSFEWLWGWTTQLSLFISYTKAIELLIICYFYLDVASKMMHWSSVAGKRSLSIFVSAILYFASFALSFVQIHYDFLGCVSRRCSSCSPTSPCFWLLASSYQSNLGGIVTVILCFAFSSHVVSELRYRFSQNWRLWIWALALFKTWYFGTAVKSLLLTHMHIEWDLLVIVVFSHFPYFLIKCS